MAAVNLSLVPRKRPKAANTGSVDYYSSFETFTGYLETLSVHLPVPFLPPYIHILTGC